MNSSSGGRLTYTVTVAAGLGAIAVYVGVLSWAVQHTTYDAWGGFVLGPLLFLAMVPVVRLLTQAEPEVWLYRVLLSALAVKLVASLVRYAVALDLYQGKADANAYNVSGRALADSFRHLDFTVDLGRRLLGTGFVDAITGVVYAVIGPTKLGGYLVFALFSFWGQYLLFRAFRTGIPDGDHRRYALLVFFAPSLLFWPSSIGKEAWMMLGIGTCAYGVARLFTHARGGFLVLAVGLTATGFVRPHVSLLILAGTAAGLVMRRSRRGDPTVEAAAKVVGVIVLLTGTVLLAGQATKFFKVDDLDPSSVSQLLDETAQRTAQGSSSFATPSARSLIRFPQATVTVLFRPFPTETSTLQAAVASLEGAALLLLTLLSVRRLLQLPAALFRVPYLAFATTYLLLFVYGFSNFANFGLLARQRVQVLPFLFVLLALPMDGIAAGRKPAVNKPAVYALNRG